MQQRVQPLGGPAPPACTAAVRTVGGAQRVRRRRRERVHERVEGRHGVAAHVAVRVAIGGAGVRVLVVVHRRRRVHRRRGAHWGARHSGRHAVCNETVAVGSVGHGAGGCASLSEHVCRTSMVLAAAVAAIATATIAAAITITAAAATVRAVAMRAAIRVAVDAASAAFVLSSAQLVPAVEGAIWGRLCTSVGMRAIAAASAIAAAAIAAAPAAANGGAPQRAVAIWCAAAGAGSLRRRLSQLLLCLHFKLQADAADDVVDVAGLRRIGVRRLRARLHPGRAAASSNAARRRQ
mmetsp:Transcript_12308/g.36102  ORF Transcript_12308/g.36102 Transcript_12308/m.36102 type:complete len:293 (+) Transcript_12308:189-1067(+)